MKKICNYLFIMFGVFFACSACAKNPIRTLILTGQNNHNWPVSSVAIKQILENSAQFQVDIISSPAKGEDLSSFIVDFSPYSLVVVDYNGDAWPEETRNNFVQYAQKGGGIIIYHAADNPFPDWKAYSEICALGGWEGRDENFGPYVYWQDNALVKDWSPGPGGSHGKQREYVLSVRNTDHPIVKGLPMQWLHAQDELYDRMRGPGNIKDILYTAYSEKETGGSGREEPLVFTVDYGKARIFHIMLGHAGETLEKNTAMQCAGFQELLLRGAEWAATGKVTRKVPVDFPTADRVVMRMDYK
ncbi:MAG: ThuA domain-containing protein [Massilibacteroides sp.]|nr:ThuA domain-containing protein [Massilibacteroides sp.]MDD3061632.1 ThuA domain-containing protein [Massilibacteroides sp.]MDD4114905.1 ThuA domain-containing protein [Massilibacteroides sp.]MDD4659984.1 ThuA domain-containing protein [Massilibacteroides sp.]